MRPAVRAVRPPFLLALALVVGTGGCGGYVPVRWPRRELWAPSADPRPPITLPSGDIAAYPGRIEREQVAVAVEVIDRQQTQSRFHADLLGRRIQPLMVVIANRSGRTYRFSKARVDPPVMAAARAADGTPRFHTMSVAGANNSNGFDVHQHPGMATFPVRAMAASRSSSASSKVFIAASRAFS